MESDYEDRLREELDALKESDEEILGMGKEAEKIYQIRGGTRSSDELKRYHRLIFIPFNIYWRTIIVISILIWFVMEIYNMIFLKNVSNFVGWIIFLWGINVIDVVLTISHRLWKTIARSRSHKSKNLIFICGDLLTLIPIHLIFEKVQTGVKPPVFIVTTVLLVNFLRLNKVIYFWEDLQNEILLKNQHLVILLKFLTYLSILTMSFGSAWYLTIEKYFKINFLDTLQYMDLNKSDPFDVFFSSVTISYQYLNGNLLSYLRPESRAERLLILILMILAHVYFYLVYLASFLHIFTRQHHHLYQFKNYMIIIKKTLKNLRMKYTDREKIIRYYTGLWKHWIGLYQEDMTDIFPLSLRKDLMLDIYWDAIQHSHSLRLHGMALKRSLSLIMKTELTSPEQTIYRKGEVKSEMKYLIKGCWEVMSDMDSKYPLLSLTPGTVLGSSSLILPTKCSTNLRCATFCEQQTLKTKDFWLLLRFYPWEMRLSRYRIFDRLQDAQKIITLGKEVVGPTPLENMIHFRRDKIMRWLKFRWLSIAAFQNISGKPYVSLREATEVMPVNIAYTSKYLSLAGMENIEKTKKKFMLHHRWPFVISYESDFTKYWNFTMIFLIFLQTILLPYFAAFSRSYPNWMVSFMIFCSFVFILDIYFMFITAIKTKTGEIIDEPSPIIRYRLATFSGIVDLISGIPFGGFAWLYNKQRVSTIYELIRLLKVIRLIEYYTTFETRIQAPTFFLRKLRFIVSILLLTYWNACLIYILACYENYSYNHKSWYINLIDKIDEKHPGSVNQVSNFTLSLYTAFSQVFPAEAANIKIVTKLDIICFILIRFIGTTFTIYVMTNLAGVKIQENSEKSSFVELINNFNEFMKNRKFKESTIQLINRYLLCQWNYNNASDILQEKEIFHDGSDLVKNLVTSATMDKLQKVWLFNGQTQYSTIFRLSHIKSIKYYRFAPNVKILESGMKPMSFNYIVSGLCRVISINKADLKRHPQGILIGPDQFFPTWELVYDCKMMSSVYSATEVELITISTLEIYDSIKNFELYKTYTTSLINRAPIFDKLSKNLNVTYKWKFHEIDYWKIKRKQGATSTLGLLFRCLMMRFCIVPSSEQAFYIELFVVVLRFFRINFFLLFYTFFKPVSGYNADIIALLFDAVRVIEIYTKLQIGYFKRCYIQTDVIDIFARYMLNSFVFDFVSSLPIYLFLDVTMDRNSSVRAWFLITLIKIIPLCHIIVFFRLAEKIHNLNKLYFNIVKYFIILFICFNLMTNVMAQYFCHFRYSKNIFVDVKCECIVPSMSYQNMKTVQQALGHALYILVILFTGLSSESLDIHRNYDFWFVIIIGIVSYIIRLNVFIRLTSLIIREAGEYVRYTEKLKFLMKFIEKADPQIKRDTYGHYHSTWLKNKGVSVFNAIKTFHPSIKTELTYPMYGITFKRLNIFNTDGDLLIKYLCNAVSEELALKNTVVLEKNDINDHMYILKEGEIQINTTLFERPFICTPPLIFGCLNSVGKKVRHKLEFQVHKEAQLLHLPAKKFFCILKYFPEIYKNFVHLTEPEKEYLVPNYKLIKRRRNKQTAFDKLADEFPYKFNLQFMQTDTEFTTDSIIYIVLNLIISYLTPYFTVVLIFGYILFPHMTSLVYYIYMSDALMLLRIFLRRHMPFIDNISGNLITDKQVICEIYFGNFWGIYLDILCCFPLYGFLYMSWDYTILTRLFRILIFYKYLTQGRTHMLITSAFWRWLDICLLTYLLTFCLSIFWTYTFCLNGCKIYTTPLMNETTLTKPHTIESYLAAFTIILGIQSRSGNSYNQIPSNAEEAFMLAIIKIIFWIVCIVSIGIIARVMEIEDNAKYRYEYKSFRALEFLRTLNLSKPLQEKADNSAHLLWVHQKGRMLPEFVENAPPYLRRKIMIAVYEKLVVNQEIFTDTSHDFRSLLCSRLNRSIHFPGDFITTQGDVDNCLYFIQIGEVEILQQDKQMNETPLGILSLGDNFGLLQLLFPHTPQSSAYKARTYSEIVYLRGNDFYEVMSYFPEDSIKIYNRSKYLPYEFTHLRY